MQLLKLIGWTIAGLVLAFVLILGIQSINSVRFPLPADLDMTDREAMSKYVATLPAGALWTVLAAYFVGTSAGSWLATRYNALGHAGPGIALGVLLLAAGIMNLVQIPHPTWMAIATVAVFPLATLLGISLARRRPVNP